MTHPRTVCQRWWVPTWGVLVVLAGVAPVGAQQGTLAEPFPIPTSNAALHYQRGLLYLAKLEEAETTPLARPIWEILVAVEKKVPDEIARLLRRGRFAIRSAATGSRAKSCDFGVEFEDQGAATPLPHVEGMVELGRLLTLRGALAEAQGHWERAAIIYFDGLRMGRHLTHQSTLLEALAGIEILRNNYFALSRWAARCPERPLVARAFGLLESMQRSLVDPSQVLAREASIMSLDFDRLQAAYPNGPWAAMILDSLGQRVTGKSTADRQAAVNACVKRGVPRDVFTNPKAFRDYLAKIRATSHRFAESVAASMTLPPKARLLRAEALNQKYAKLIKMLTEDTLLDVVTVAALTAEHEAELTVTRIALAVSASKADGKFPYALRQISDRFGGAIPANPYTGQPISYTTLNEAQAFSLVIPGVGRLPSVEFNSTTPAAAE